MICCTLSTLDANVAIIILLLVFSEKIWSKVFPTFLSDGVNPGLNTLVLSHIKAKTPFFPNSLNLHKLIASPKTGV